MNTPFLDHDADKKPSILGIERDTPKCEHHVNLMPGFCTHPL